MQLIYGANYVELSNLHRAAELSSRSSAKPQNSVEMLKVVSGWITINNKITDLSEFVVFILTDLSVDSVFWSNDVSMLNIINL